MTGAAVMLTTGEFLHVLVGGVAIGVLGGLLGMLLSALARITGYRVDVRLATYRAALPGYDCGTCGYATCNEYARAIRDRDTPSKCVPGGRQTARLLSEALGIEVKVSGARRVAQVHCRAPVSRSSGSDPESVGHPRTAVREKFRYSGHDDCNSAARLYGGDRECVYGCLGHGSCARVCPVNAIGNGPDGRVWVDRNLCVSCGLCLDVCPTGVLKWVPASADVIIGCNSPDSEAQVAEYCSLGCTGCRLCERKSPAGGYHVEHNLCNVDYTQKGDRRDGMEACPTRCILPAGSIVPIGRKVSTSREESPVQSG